MIEVVINDRTTILDEFKVERVYEWDSTLRKNILVHKTYVCMSNITKELADKIKDQIRAIILQKVLDDLILKVRLVLMLMIFM